MENKLSVAVTIRKKKHTKIIFDVLKVLIKRQTTKKKSTTETKSVDNIKPKNGKTNQRVWEKCAFFFRHSVVKLQKSGSNNPHWTHFIIRIELVAFNCGHKHWNDSLEYVEVKQWTKLTIKEEHKNKNKRNDRNGTPRSTWQLTNWAAMNMID